MDEEGAEAAVSEDVRMPRHEMLVDGRDLGWRGGEEEEDGGDRYSRDQNAKSTSILSSTTDCKR